MKQKLWLTLTTCLAYCIERELYKAIDYLREQARVLIEQQEKTSASYWTTIKGEEPNASTVKASGA